MRFRVVATAALLALGACSGGRSPSEPPPLIYANFDVDFRSVAVDALAVVEVPVRNLGGADSVLRATVAAPFGVLNPTPILVPADGEVILRVSFQPTVAGAAAGQLVLAFENTRNPPVAVVLRGNGVLPEIAIEPGQINFGAVPLGARTTPYRVAITNVGEVPAAITATLAPGGPFYFSRTGAGGKQELLESLELPPLVPEASSQVELVYRPVSTTSPADVAWLEIRPCGSCDAIPVQLDGRGVPVPVSSSVSEIDMGEVLVGESALRSLELAGLPPLDLPFELLELHIEGPAAGAFVAEGIHAPRPVESGERLQVPVRFTPGFVGAAAATLVARVKGGEVRVPLGGRGTSSQFVVSPASIDFGLWPVGSTASRIVEVNVVGDGAPTVFTSARFEGSDVFHAALPAAPFTLPSMGLQVPVSMTADGPGSFEGELVLDPGSAGQVQVRIPLRGTAVPSDFCSLWVSPSPLRFGLRPASSSTTRVVRLQNAGAGACSFGGLELRGSSVFSIGGGRQPEVRTLASGESVEVVINYRPASSLDGEIDAAVLRVLQPNRSVPELLVPITGQGSGRLAGSAGNFAAVPVGEAGLSAVTLRNDGRSSVIVLGAKLADGSSSSFALAGGVPAEVGPESSTSIPVAFRPRHTGKRTEELEVLTDAGTEPVIVELSAEGISGCSGASCGGLVVTCPGTFSAPAYDWVQLGTAALHPAGKQVECTVTSLGGLRPEVIQTHGCDADVILAQAGQYDLQLTARTDDGDFKSCKVTVVARQPDGLVVRSQPNPATADLDLRLFSPDAGSPSEENSWSSDHVCWSGNASPGWSSASSIDDPVFHNGRNGMPDVIRIPEPARSQKLGIGVRWAGGTGDQMTAVTEVFCNATSEAIESSLSSRYSGEYVADVTINEAGTCKVTHQGTSVYVR